MADERQRFTRVDLERDPLQDLDVGPGWVMEIDVAELYGAYALFGNDPARVSGVDLGLAIEKFRDSGDGFISVKIQGCL